MTNSLRTGVALALGITGILILGLWFDTPAFNPLNVSMIPPVSAQECVVPPLLSHSVSPGTHFQYFYYGAWSDIPKQCTMRAFDTWNIALQDQDISFSLASSVSTSNINVMMKTLPQFTGGAITEVSRRSDGYVRGGGVVITNNPATVSSCVAYYKIGLHEVGHLLGLGHPNGTNESSIMNNMQGFNDVGNAIPLFPTSCDVARIHDASKTPRMSITPFAAIAQ